MASSLLASHPFATALARNWWVLLLRGILAILIALLLWFQPAIAIGAAMLVFGIFALIDGVLGVWMAFSHRRTNPQWWLLLLWGLAGIGIGVITFISPPITWLVLLMFLAAWSIITGVLQIVAAVGLRKEIEGEWLLGLGGLVSVIFGAMLVWRPVAGSIAVAWVVGIYAFIWGIVLVMLSFRVKKLAPRV